MSVIARTLLAGLTNRLSIEHASQEKRNTKGMTNVTSAAQAA